LLRTHDIPSTAVSVFLQQVSASSPTLAVNAQVPRNPASVMKLLTTLVALETLGPNYRWRTEAYVRGALRGGVLDGDLILKGYADPYLTPERFWELLRGLRDRGLRRVRGDVIVDDAFLAKPSESRGDFDGRPYRAYNALPYALSLNFQATQLHLRPDEGAAKVRAFTYPPLANLKIRNDLRLESGPCRKRHLSPGVHVAQDARGATVALKGSFSVDCPEWENTYLVMEPDTHVGGAFDALWRELGGEVDGIVKRGVKPQGAKLFHNTESPTLGEVIRGMNKYSNNLMSRLLMLTVAAEAYGAPGTLEKGRRAVEDWERSKGHMFAGLRVGNGSGLSRIARVSAADLGQMLLAAYHSPVMPEFMASLAIAGVDGTMRRRLRDSEVAGRGHIKTGSLNNVSAMAGYVLDRGNRRWAVALLINHPGLMHWQGRQIQDRLLRCIYDAPDTARHLAKGAANPAAGRCGWGQVTPSIAGRTAGSAAATKPGAG
jgi:D-alanyl-D-alanine carboxypeptidase/D-alanyl-D-alanine-endopeptidase (penicillin-binding protein 4)